MAFAHVFEPGFGDGIAEAAQREHLDHDAELVVLADEGDLGVNDPDAGARLDLDEAELSQQHQGFAQGRERQAEQVAQLVLGDHHAGLQLALLHGGTEAAVAFIVLADV